MADAVYRGANRNTPDKLTIRHIATVAPDRDIHKFGLIKRKCGYLREFDTYNWVVAVGNSVRLDAQRY